MNNIFYSSLRRRRSPQFDDTIIHPEILFVKNFKAHNEISLYRFFIASYKKGLYFLASGDCVLNVV